MNLPPFYLENVLDAGTLDDVSDLSQVPSGKCCSRAAKFKQFN